MDKPRLETGKVQRVLGVGENLFGFLETDKGEVIFFNLNNGSPVSIGHHRPSLSTNSCKGMNCHPFVHQKLMMS